jgi:hypothetical protein
MTVSDFFQNGISLQAHYPWLLVSFVLALAILLYLARNDIKLAGLNIKTRYLLSRLGVKVISDFRFPDGLGSYFVVDRLVLRQDGISLLVFKQYPGSIFCAEDIDQWTQLLAGKSYRFKNPLIDLDYMVKAVSACVPNVPVNGFLFFDHQARFPKGHPDRVIRLDTIPQSLLRVKKTRAQASVVSAWEKLSAMSAAV